MLGVTTKDLSQQCWLHGDEFFDEVEAYFDDRKVWLTQHLMQEHRLIEDLWVQAWVIAAEGLKQIQPHLHIFKLLLAEELSNMLDLFLCHA